MGKQPNILEELTELIIGMTDKELTELIRLFKEETLRAGDAA